MINVNTLKNLSIEQAIRALGGTVVLVTLFLSLFSKYFLFLTAFAGFNLLQSAFTGICPVIGFFRKFGLKTELEKFLETQQKSNES